MSNFPLPLKLVFVSPFNLFDVANGAVRSIRTMLEQLSQHGVICHALTACCFDSFMADPITDTLRRKGLSLSGQIQSYGIPVWQGKVNDVFYHAIQISTERRDQITAVEELVFRDAVQVWLRENRPDIFLTFGGLLLDIELQRCAKASGAKVVFYLANTCYARRETFEHVDLILTNSKATAAHYARTLNLHCHNIGVLVDTVPVIAKQREPQFITFINPLPEKGVALFLKLVEKAAQEAPDMRFLVVEGRGLLSKACEELKIPPTLFDRITVLPKQENMAIIYAKTRILLMPSFWIESAGRVLVEACVNGIPVIASNLGGIPETLDSAGKLLPIPERCQLNHWLMPDDEEIEPWWQELLKLWPMNEYYQMYSNNALGFAQIQSLENKVENLLQLIKFPSA